MHLTFRKTIACIWRNQTSSQSYDRGENFLESAKVEIIYIFVKMLVTTQTKSKTSRQRTLERLSMTFTANGKRQTAKIELLVSDFSRLYNLGKLFAFTVIKGFFSYFSTGFI